MSIGGHSIAALLIHDRGPIPWLIVASYFLGAIAAFWASRSARKRERVFWLGTALLLVFLGLNKELDLQTLMTAKAKIIAHRGGWYDQRRAVQGLFLLALAGVGGLALVALLRWLRKSATQVKTAAAGIVLLFIFVVMRAASFHHIDRWITVNIAGMRSGWWIELAGIAVIGLSAFAFRRHRRKR